MYTKKRINEIVYEQMVSAQALRTFHSGEDIRGELHLTDDLGFDSLDLMEMTMNFEQEYGINIPDEVIDSWETIQSIYDYFEV